MILSEKENLVVFRICLATGIITTSNIEKWAISTYQKSEVLRIDYILELCSANTLGINNTFSILKQEEDFSDKAKIKKLIYGIAGHLFRLNRISIKKATKLIDFTAAEINYEVTLEKDIDYYIDDMVYLASQGIYNIDNIIKEILDATKPYEKDGENFIKENFNIN